MQRLEIVCAKYNECMPCILPIYVWSVRSLMMNSLIPKCVKIFLSLKPLYILKCHSWMLRYMLLTTIKRCTIINQQEIVCFLIFLNENQSVTCICIYFDTPKNWQKNWHDCDGTDRPRGHDRNSRGVSEKPLPGQIIVLHFTSLAFIKAGWSMHTLNTLGSVNAFRLRDKELVGVDGKIRGGICRIFLKEKTARSWKRCKTGVEALN